MPGDAVDVYTLEKALKHPPSTSGFSPYESDNVQWLIDMAAAAVGGHDKPARSPSSALCLRRAQPDLQAHGRRGPLPLRQGRRAGAACSLPTAGANTPVTAQGTAFIACAEVFAMIIMLELLCPGLPVIATTLLFSMDMQTTYTLQSNTQITIARLICMELFERG